MAFNIFCRAALEDRAIEVYGDGTQTRDFTYVEDVVAATRAAAQAPIEPGGAYNIGGGLRASLLEVIAAIEEIAGRPVRRLHSVSQAGDVRDTGADTTKARRDLGFAPRTSLQDGIAAEFEWLRSQVAARVAA
jgi:UDP-glucose 4-epimerase